MKVKDENGKLHTLKITDQNGINWILDFSDSGGNPLSSDFSWNDEVGLWIGKKADIDFWKKEIAIYQSERS